MYTHISPEVFTGKGNKIGLLECDGTLTNRESQMIQRNLLPQNVEIRTEAARSLKMLVIINKTDNCNLWAFWIICGKCSALPCACSLDG